MVLWTDFWKLVSWAFWRGDGGADGDVMGEVLVCISLLDLDMASVFIVFVKGKGGGGALMNEIFYLCDSIWLSRYRGGDHP